MTAIILAILFVLQLGSFYWIALLYMRLSKLDSTEEKQKQLMKEMEDSLALYMSEVKEENDRLIEQLTQAEVRPLPSVKADEPQERPSDHPPKPSAEPPASFQAPKPPAKRVMNTYLAQQRSREGSVGNGPAPAERAEETEFERISRLHTEGLSAGDIARRLGKGKTEIELILKFKQE